MQNRIINIGPIALTNVLTTNIVNPALTSLLGPVGFAMPQPYLILRQVHILNVTAIAATFSFWKGIAGANLPGKEFIGSNISIAAFGTFDYYVPTRLDAADFIVGGSNTANALTITFYGEIGVSG